MQEKKYEFDYHGKKIEVEIGKFARQTNAACTVRLDDTVILATVVMRKEIEEAKDFFPLLVDYRENLYAVGRISSSKWVKREGRPSEEATLTGRLIDRSIRPLFNEKIRNDVQVVITVMSVDEENDPDIPGLIGASIALSISNIPFDGPIGAAKVVKVNDELVINPTFEQVKQGDFNVTVVGVKGQVVMLEAEANETSEEEIEKAIKFGLDGYSQLIDFINGIIKDYNPQKMTEILEGTITKEWKERKQELKKVVDPKVEETYKKILGEKDINTRQATLDEMEKKLIEDTFKNETSEDDTKIIKELVGEKINELLRLSVLNEEKRIDGRKLDEIRSLSAEVGLLPRTHGSGLFSRGETQIFSNVTLGPPSAQQYFETLEEPEGRKRYMHHYNFPGYSTGEVTPFRGPGRRELGHGALAEKSLVPVLPSKDDFPYTIRVVSDVMSSNGSTSQGSVCGSTLALMHAGVPIKNPVAGIAIGLITNEDDSQYKILTDIQGLEDHAGDMDFKVAGTKDGITAIQLDIKLGGISMDMVKDAIKAAKKARLEILEVILNCIKEPNKKLSPYAPRIEKITINPDKIKDVIGPGGKVINGIIEETGVAIDIEDDGTVFITSEKSESMKQAITFIKNIVKEAEVGEIYEGKVVQIISERNGPGEIGAIVELWPDGKDGMVHISQFRHERINKVSDIVQVGDTLKVKVVSIDVEKDRIELSHKVLLPRTEYGRDKDRSDDKRQPAKKRFFSRKK